MRRLSARHEETLWSHALGIASFTATLMQSVLLPLLGSLPTELGILPDSASWLMTITVIAAASTTLAAGRLAERIGEIRTILACMGLLVLGSLIGAAADELWPLLVARALQGAGLAAIPMTMSAARRIAPSRSARVQGVIAVHVGAGGALGYLVCAAAAQLWGLSGVFLLSAGLGTVAILGLVTAARLAARPRPRVRTSGRPDVVGLLGAAGTAVLALLAVTGIGRWGATSPPTLILAASALALGAAWWKHEMRHPDPVIDPHQAAAGPPGRTNAATLLVGAAMYTGMISLPQLLQDPSQGFALTPITSALVLMPAALAATFAPRWSARAIESRGPGTVLRLAALLQLCGFVVLALLHGTIAGIIAGSILTNTAFSVSYAASPALAMNLAGDGQAGAAATNALARNLGTAISGAAVGAILASSTGIAYTAALALGAALAAAGLVVAARLPEGTTAPRRAL